jgi:hypothetical protein
VFYIITHPPRSSPHIDKTVPLKVAVEKVVTPEEIFDLPSSLRFIDIVVSKTGKSLVFDLKALNRSDDTIYIHGLDVYRVPKGFSDKQVSHFTQLPSGIYTGGRPWEEEEIDGKKVVKKSFSISQVLQPRSWDRFQIKFTGNHDIKSDIEKANDWFVKVLYGSSDASNKSLIYYIHFLVFGSRL